jgi:hypothetical protein
LVYLKNIQLSSGSCKVREVFKLATRGDLKTYSKVTPDVGLFVTERFYYLFPWQTCTVNNNVNFNLLSEVFELAHGTNQRINSNFNPFEPPENHKWEINWVAPHG